MHLLQSGEIQELQSLSEGKLTVEGETNRSESIAGLHQITCYSDMIFSTVVYV